MEKLDRVKSSLANQGNKNSSIKKGLGNYFSLREKEEDVQRETS